MQTLNDSQQAIPCGKIARSFFTDTFKLVRGKIEEEGTENITIIEKGIAWH